MSSDVTVGVAPAPGSTVGPWLLLEDLDSGSFGFVYQAQRAGHPEAKAVALKLARQAMDARFEREGEVLQRLRHPSIPGFQDAGVWTGPNGHRYPYLVMEWIPGFVLYDWMREQPRTSRQVLRVAAQVASALATAHAGGVLHRDVKGDNIRVQDDGRAVLLDWGSGWFPGARELTDRMAPGTWAYRPPEQFAFLWQFRREEKARWNSTPAGDLYSLGVALYRAVTGVYLPPSTEGDKPVERDIVPPGALATVNWDLELLILRLISDELRARGTAEEIARLAWEAALTTNVNADKPILPIVSARPEKGRPESEESSESEDQSASDSASSRSDPPTRRRRAHRGSAVPVWLSVANTILLVGVLVVVALGLRRQTPLALKLEPAPEPEPIAEEWHAPQVEVPDAGVGDDVLLSSVEAPRAPAPSSYKVSRPMPKTPFPGQKKPPCEPSAEVTALGACWIITAKSPPCGNYAYELDGQCLLVIFPEPRQPTSEKP